MTSGSVEYDRRSWRPVVAGSLLLGAVLIAVAVCAAGVRGNSVGSEGFAACFVAAFVCWASGTAALAITALTAGTTNGLAGLLGSIFLRTGIPIAVGILMCSAGLPLAKAGLFGLLVVHYLAGLIVETTVSVYLIGSRFPVRE